MANEIVKYEQVKDRIVVLRGDNQAVKNNQDKFPDGYLFRLDNQEFADLRSKISTSSWGGNRQVPTAFTEWGVNWECDWLAIRDRRHGDGSGVEFRSSQNPS